MTTTPPQCQQHEVETLASSLSETLTLHFPQGPPQYDEKLVQRWLNELAEATSDDVSHQVLQLAVQQWKEQTPEIQAPTTTKTATAVTSFSLLDQLSAMPMKRIFYDDIAAASSPTQRLELLQQVDHVDDVAGDWKNVLPLLLEGLHDGDNIRDYIKLHGKWFEQCAQSAEYTSLQFGLCSNLVQALRQFFGQHVFVSNADCLRFTEKQELIYEMMLQWHGMWMSSMKNFSPNDCNQMMRDVMQLMRNLAPPFSVRFVLLPAHFLALMDPYADWFALWMRQVSPVEALDCILSTGLFQDVIQRCRLEGREEWKADQMNDSDTIVIEEGKDVHVSRLERALWQQSLCMLQSLLVHVRVALFPWNQLMLDNATTSNSQVPHTCLLEPTPEEKEPFQPKIWKEVPIDKAREVMRYFFKMLEDDDKTVVGAKMKAVCFEAIETILCGLQDDELLDERATFEALNNASVAHSS